MVLLWLALFLLIMLLSLEKSWLYHLLLYIHPLAGGRTRFTSKTGWHETPGDEPLVLSKHNIIKHQNEGRVFNLRTSFQILHIDVVPRRSRLRSAVLAFLCCVWEIPLSCPCTRKERSGEGKAMFIEHLLCAESWVNSFTLMWFSQQPCEGGDVIPIYSRGKRGPQKKDQLPVWAELRFRLQSFPKSGPFCQVTLLLTGGGWSLTGKQLGLGEMVPLQNEMRIQ